MSYDLNGRYPATLGKGVLTEAKSGALMYYVEVLIENVPPMRGSFCMVKSDGTLMQRNIEDLIKILDGRWDGADIAALEAVDPTGCEVIADCADGEPRNGKVYTEVRNIYPPNGGGAKLPDKVDAKSVSSKYGAKFRAMFGTRAKPVTPTKPTTTAPKPPPVAPRTPPPPASTATATSSLEECWALFEAKYQNAGMKDAAIADKWIADVPAFGIDQATATPEQWGKFKATLVDANGEALPF